MPLQPPAAREAKSRTTVASRIPHLDLRAPIYRLLHRRVCPQDTLQYSLRQCKPRYVPEENEIRYDSDQWQALDVTHRPPTPTLYPVTLGESGLKVSRLILGAMQYGSPMWQPWILEEETAIQHIKAAYVATNKPAFVKAGLTWALYCSYDLGIQTFDVSDVRNFDYARVPLLI